MELAEFTRIWCVSACKALNTERRNGYLHIDYTHPMVDCVWFCERRTGHYPGVEKVFAAPEKS